MVVGVVALWLFSRGVSWVVGRSEAAKVVKAIMECKRSHSQERHANHSLSERTRPDRRYARLDRKPGYLAAAACVPMRLVPHLANGGHGLKFTDWDAKIGIEGQQNLN